MFSFQVDSFEEDVVDNTAGEEEQLAAKKAEKLAQEQEENSGSKIFFIFKNISIHIGGLMKIINFETFCAELQLK